MCSRIPKMAIYEISLPENDTDTKVFLGKETYQALEARALP